MHRLLEVGFEPAGSWFLEGGILRFELQRHSIQKNILYAFVSDGQIKYIGKTVRSLSQRMSGYRTPGKTQTTNINNNSKIKKLLAKGAAVEILALPDGGLLHYGKFHLNLAAALEDDLIRVIKPVWNGGKVEDVDAIAAESQGVEQSDLEASVLPVATFTFNLARTYFEQGFFNGGAVSSALLGPNGSVIELFLGGGGDDEPVLGTINRTANNNGAPRIMGGADLRKWFKAEASVDQAIVVEVMSPTSIRLKVRS